MAVADVPRATAFYRAIGCTQDEQFSNAQASAMAWSDTISFMLLDRAFFASFTPKPVADAHEASEVLLCLSQDSRADVDAIVEKAKAAGGRVDVRPPQDMGFMYGRTFEDPDGHIFEPMHMDLDAALSAMATQS